MKLGKYILPYKPRLGENNKREPNGMTYCNVNDNLSKNERNLALIRTILKFSFSCKRNNSF